MENSIASLDPRIAMALSGEFCVPTDPDRLHTASRLYMAAMQQGEAPESGIMVYRPDWAPIEVLTQIGETLYMAVGFTERQRMALFLEQRGEDIVFSGYNFSHRDSLPYTTPEEISRAATRISHIFGLFLAEPDNLKLAEDGSLVLPERITSEGYEYNPGSAE